ncbi:MAG: hypothetical protein HQL53_01885 [Magnetococcales bacterium]|nr:hypothetical protein [Magnetococcales bacterium]
MSFFSFLGSFGMAKMEEGLKAGATALAKIDPEAASQAQIDMLDKKLGELRSRLVKAQRAFDKDLKETADWQEKEKKTLEAMQILKARHASNPDDGSILEKARRLRASLDNIHQNIEREQREDAQAKGVLDQVQALYDKVKKRRTEMTGQLQNAKQRMTQAQLAEEQAKLNEQEAKELSDMEGGFDELGIALDAMNQAANQAEHKAAVANLTADEIASRGSTGDEGLLDDILGDQKKVAVQNSDPFAGL